MGGRFLSETPNARGYDYFFGTLSGAIDYYEKDIGLKCGTAEDNFMPVFANDCVFLNGYDLQENGVPYVEETEKYVTDMFADKGVDAIRAHDPKQPMLMTFHPTGPRIRQCNPLLICLNSAKG